MRSQIKKLVIAVGNKEIELTIDEAKQLHKELAALFDKPPFAMPPPVIIERPYRWPNPWMPVWSSEHTDIASNREFTAFQLFGDTSNQEPA